MAGSSEKPYDLLVVLDATTSMGYYIKALKKSLPEIVSIAALTGCFERIGVLVYRDYCDSEIIKWSGWCCPSGVLQGEDIVSQESVLNMTRNIDAMGGGDDPEAAKSGLARGYREMRESAKTLILFFADAAPHFAETGGPNYKAERKALTLGGDFGDSNQSSDKWTAVATLLRRVSLDDARRRAIETCGDFGSSAGYFVEWTSAAQLLKNGPKKGIVFSIIQRAGVTVSSPYVYLSTMTGGTMMRIENATADKISQITVGALLSWMGLGKTMTGSGPDLGAVGSYNTSDDIEAATTETSPTLDKYIARGREESRLEQAEKNIRYTYVNLVTLPASIEARGPHVQELGKRYKEDPVYQRLVIDQLTFIIRRNVSAISVNPVFGTLWRVVCSDRKNVARVTLGTMFGLEVEKVHNPDEKQRLKAWLEESYGHAEDINHMIKSLPKEEQFPRLLLDPTQDFTATSGGEEKDSDNRPLNEFTRAELLEIGRSCEFRIQQRLGRVLTRLTYIERVEDLPYHLRTAERVPYIPLALAKPKHKRQFWKVLLHAVLPGTSLSARPAALLAALSLRMGITVLRDMAYQELLAFRNYWNDIDTPENWTMGCLNLLLNADKDYESRVQQGLTARPTPESGILNETDRQIFQTLVDYKMLEQNLSTTLQARLTWTPKKSKVSLGPVVVCKRCQYPRSVTMMSSGGVCGICEIEEADCTCEACTTTPDYAHRKTTNVAKDNNEKTQASWVECCKPTCLAQYVVYCTDSLRLRPKCFYCRHAARKPGQRMVGSAPVVECSACLSRMLWPEEYRPIDLDVSAFKCPACEDNVVTIIDQDTTAAKVNVQNGQSWILKNQDRAIANPFDGRTIFFTASHGDIANFPSKVVVFPAGEHRLALGGKLVQNTPDLVLQLQKWVKSGQKELIECSLCFSSYPKSKLRLACGRKGCEQHVCGECLKEWYGINSPGKIINVAALSCPFCRRQPTVKTVRSFGLTGLGDLQKVIHESGVWVFAWCARCGFAKRYIERVCAVGAPPEIVDWRCDDCNTSNGKKTMPKNCPSCGVMVEKTGGCDHISCVCGSHWCYACGEGINERRIYRHIAQQHGGWWDDEDEDAYMDDEFRVLDDDE